MKKNPNVSNNEELYIVSLGQQEVEDSNLNTLRANIILWSYNRPKMLKEAIDSVFNQTYKNWVLHVLDDGSTFDVVSLLESYNSPKIVLYQNPKLTPEQRVSEKRDIGLGETTNNILKEIPKGEVIYYLCDDDVMHPSWISRSIQALQSSPISHVVQGEVYSFTDSIENATFGVPGFEDPREMWWGAGTFCHMSDCYHVEKLCWYDNDYGHSQDLQFIMDAREKHPRFLFITSPSIYRREHPKSLSNLLGNREEGKLVDTDPQPIEPSLVEGLME